MSADNVDVKAIEDKVVEIISEQMGADKSEITRETSFINDLTPTRWIPSSLLWSLKTNLI